MRTLTPTPDTLNDVMEMDHVIRVHPDGTVSDHVEGEYAPECYWVEGAAPYDLEGYSDDWTPHTGASNQQGYSGPIMHASEYIAGGLARHILSTPGLWVATTAEDMDDPENPAGWVLFFKESE